MHNRPDAPAGKNAGHFAALAGCGPVLDMLGAYQFNFNAADKDDGVPLTTLVSNGNTVAAEIVVQQGAVVDRIDRGGKTGLHLAIEADDPRQIQAWLQLGANSDKPVVDRTRETPLMLAAKLHVPGDAVLALLEAGANPNKPGRRLAAGADAGSELVLNALLEVGTEHAIAAANSCVRHGAKYNQLSVSVTNVQKETFNLLAKEHLTERKKKEEHARSMAQAGGAAALASAVSCLLAGPMVVKGSKWSQKFFVLSKEAGEGAITNMCR